MPFSIISSLTAQIIADTLDINKAERKVGIIMIQYNQTALQPVVELSTVVTVLYVDFERFAFGPTPEQHDFYEWTVVDHGTLTVLLDDVPYTVHSGEGLLYPRNAVHHFTPVPTDQRVGIVSFSSPSPLLETLTGQVFRLTAEQKRLFFEILRDGLPLFDSYARGMKKKEGVGMLQLQVIKNKTELLLLSLLGAEPTPAEKEYSDSHADDLPQQIKAFLTDNLDTPLSLSLLCRVFGISQTKLKTAFRGRYGCGVMDFFTDLKMREAKRLIRQTDLTVAEIGDRLGFSSPQYFTRQFRQRIGLTPSAYRHSVQP